MLLFLRIPLSCSVHNLRDLTEMHRVTITKNTVRVCGDTLSCACVPCVYACDRDIVKLHFSISKYLELLLQGNAL